MPAEPTFMMDVEAAAGTVDFRNVPENRRGEGIAWLSSVAVGVVNFYVYLRMRSLPLPALLFLGFLTILAVLASYGNWISRNTGIRISSSHVHYSSPLRKVQLPLEEIDSLIVVPAGRGWRILVRGRGTSFSFQTTTHIRLFAGREVRYGVEQGTRLAGMIRQRAGLGPPVAGEGYWTCSRGDGGDDGSS